MFNSKLFTAAMILGVAAIATGLAFQILEMSDYELFEALYSRFVH